MIGKTSRACDGIGIRTGQWPNPKPHSDTIAVSTSGRMNGRKSTLSRQSIMIEVWQLLGPSPSIQVPNDEFDRTC